MTSDCFVVADNLCITTTFSQCKILKHSEGRVTRKVVAPNRAPRIPNSKTTAKAFSASEPHVWHRRATCRCGSCRWAIRPRGATRRPSRHRTTNSTSALPGEATLPQGGRAKDARLAVADGRGCKDKSSGLSRDDSCLDPQDRINSAGLEDSDVTSA